MELHFSNSDECWHDEEWNISISPSDLTSLVQKMAEKIVKLIDKKDVKEWLKTKPKFRDPQWTIDKDGRVHFTVFFDEEKHGDASDNKEFLELQFYTKYHVKLFMKIEEIGKSEEDPYYEKTRKEQGW